MDTLSIGGYFSRGRFIGAIVINVLFAKIQSNVVTFVLDTTFPLWIILIILPEVISYYKSIVFLASSPRAPSSSRETLTTPTRIM